MSTGSSDVPAEGRRLGLLRMAWDQALETVLAQVSPSHPDLRAAHLTLFRFSGLDGATTAELAAHAGITKQSMHELVTHLERLGYLTREPDPRNARTRPLRLTPTGRTLERQIHTAIADVLDDWRTRLGPARYDQLWETLRDLTGHTGRLPDIDEIRTRAD